jgi:hypothetical protein
MKTSTLLISSLLLLVLNVGASQRFYFNQIGVSNLTGSTISSLDVQVGKYELQCGTVNKNGYCHKMAGKRPFPEGEIKLSWTDADGKQHNQEVNVTVPATVSPGRTLRFELEIHSDGSVKWDFGQDGFRG